MKENWYRDKNVEAKGEVEKRKKEIQKPYVDTHKQLNTEDIELEKRAYWLRRLKHNKSIIEDC